MMRNILAALIVATAALTVAACSSGNGGGIGGSGIVAQGSITELGSIRVNGIRFDTGEAAISVDESSATESELKLGMVVTVVGRLDDDGVSAVADDVVYDDSLQGPVGVGGVITDADGDTQRLSILGDTVIADRALTVYDGPTGFGFDSIGERDVVRVSGFRDEDDQLAATRIEWTGRFDPADPGATEFEISGRITGLTDASFMIGPLPITYDPGSTEQPEGGLMENLFVEVEGVMASETGAFAEEIDLEHDGLPDDADEIEIEGVVRGFADLSADFTVSTVTVNAAGARFIPPSLMNTVRNGTRVEIEGSLRGGVLMAEKVKGRGGEVKIEAFVAADPAAQTIKLRIAPPDETIDVRTGEETTFKNNAGGAPLTIGTIRAGDYLRVRGFLDGEDVLASEVKRTESEERIIVQGFVQASSYSAPNGTIMMLGKTFTTDGNTEFERDGDSEDEDIVDPADFFNDIAVVGMTAVVKLVETFSEPATVGDGVIDEVDIEDDGDSDGDSD